MSSERLPTIYRKFCQVDCYLIGSNRVVRSNVKDYTVITNGLTLWYGILLDHSSKLLLTEKTRASAEGRIMKMILPIGQSNSEIDITSVLAYLDKLDTAFLNAISALDGFKDHLFIAEVKALTTSSLCGVGQTYVWLCSETLKKVRCGELGEGLALRLIRQSIVFLKKIVVDRPDVEEEMLNSFFDFEDELTNVVVPALDDIEAVEIIAQMNTLARKHLSNFTVPVLLPRHGPGAVSDPKVKSWYSKYTNVRSDARINYVLDHANLGSIKDYCPLVAPEESTRTSRYICVPKTWKKLRGINAEPIELQFFQQGVFHAIDQFIQHDKWWSKRINLHDQAFSRELARYGSIHGGYATIDLSNASDSVSLELVKRVFKGTPLLKWLLATRSTMTTCKGRTIRISKFAPMGSACCFPVECLVFALAAQVSSDRTRMRGVDSDPTVRVFGDDIIVDWYSATECITILQKLGFSVNIEKSYTSGWFREACGAEYYRGIDLVPVRFRRIGCRFLPGPVTGEDVSTILSMSNLLYERGYHETRKFLLGILFSKYYRLGSARLNVQRYISATFSGERGSLASPCPTNFNRVIKFDRGLQCLMAKQIGFHRRPSNPVEALSMDEVSSYMSYVEWQIRHQPGLVDWEERWEDGWIDSGDEPDPTARLPIGFTMVPGESRVAYDRSDSI